MFAAADQRLNQIDQCFFNEPLDLMLEVIYLIVSVTVVPMMDLRWRAWGWRTASIFMTARIRIGQVLGSHFQGVINKISYS